MGNGRPPTYKPEYAKQAAKLCELGATDLDIAEFFGVSVRTVYRWKAVSTQLHKRLNYHRFMI